MNCCGKDRKTPFCPICGKQLVDVGADLLLAIKSEADKIVNPGASPRACARLERLERWIDWIKSAQQAMIPMVGFSTVQRTHDVMIETIGNNVTLGDGVKPRITSIWPPGHDTHTG